MHALLTSKHTNASRAKLNKYDIQNTTRTMWNRSMIASQSVLKKSPYGGTYSGTYLECPKNVLKRPI